MPGRLGDTELCSLSVVGTGCSEIDAGGEVSG
jgi:hypothetical protein